MTDVTITALPAAPLHALEIWSNPAAVAQRFAAALGGGLPALGSSVQLAAMRLMRFEPTVWLVEGAPTGLTEILGPDGSITAIGGGIVRVWLSGAGWRSLLMEGGIFDAESADFGAGSSAATIVDHVNVRLYVASDDACEVYVPASFSAGLVHFWETVAGDLIE